MNYANAKREMEQFGPRMQAAIDAYSAALVDRNNENAHIEQELKSIEQHVRRKIKDAIRKSCPGFQNMIYVSCGNWIQHGKRPIVIIPKIMMRYACGGIEIRFDIPIDENLEFGISSFVNSVIEAWPMNVVGVKK